VRATRLIEILGIELRKGASLLGGSIDRPGSSERAEAENLEIAGWAMGRHRPVVAVEVLDAGGRTLARWPADLERRDVGLAFPGVPGAEMCGFRGRIRTVPEGETLRLEAVLEEGERASLGIVRFRFLEEATAERTGAVILVYHRVAELEADPWGLAVTPARFAEHMEVLRREFSPVSLSEVFEMLDAETPLRRAVAVTFDDGYADNLEDGLPELERAGVPATVFLASGYLGGAREFWWDELERLLLSPGSLPPVLELGPGACWRLDGAERGEAPGAERVMGSLRNWRAWEEPPTRRHSLYRDLWCRWQDLSGKDRERELERLREWSGRGGTVRPSHRVLSEEEAQKLAASSTIEVGAHTVSHPVLSILSEQMQRREIFDSGARLSSLLDRPVRAFAYPFGKQRDYDSTTIGLIREAGYVAACSNFPGLAETDTDRFQLPRIPALDCGGDELGFQLRSWFRG
jgi:peptidoglycan/xylan/chitin deacetylase (PgdA/CDA1 family)